MKKRWIRLAALVLGLVMAFPAWAENGETQEVWYIWGETMPVSEKAAEYDFSKAFDGADFRPHLIPYLLEDQSSVRGNILVCAGGGDRMRNNDHEGYPTCEMLNGMGYNAFLLNYRVAPYETIDMTLDVQRAVRYIKYHGDELGIAKADRIATLGFSAGAMHCYAQAIAFAGKVLPTEIYPDYPCDEVDAADANVIATACFSAAGMTHDTQGNAIDVADPILLPDEDDPKRTDPLPAFFFAGLSKHAASGFCVTAYQAMRPLTGCALHMINCSPHPFDKDGNYPDAMLVREQLEAFMNEQFGALDAK